MVSRDVVRTLVRIVAVGAAVGLTPACKKKQALPAPTPVAGVDAGAPAPRIPPATEPDPGFEARREALLRRGDPANMQPAPVIDVGKPVDNPADMIKVVSRDVMMVGAIKVDLKAGAAELPAKVGTPMGPLEYIAVGKGGKAYESLFTVEVTGVELRLALTLLGYEGTVPAADGTLAAPTAADTVLVAVRVAGKERPLADVLLDQRTGKQPVDAPWQVVGFGDGDRGQALRAADFMTLVPRDTLAPLRVTVDAGNPYAPGQGLTANAKALPVVGGDVTIVFKRRPDAPAPPPTSVGPSRPRVTP